MYLRLHYNNEGNSSSKQSEHISPEIIKKLVRDFKTHRCALDFEGKFIRKVESDSQQNSVSEYGRVVTQPPTVALL